MEFLKQFLWARFVALDIWLNVHVFKGEPGMTITKRAALAMRAGKVWGCVLCRLLDVVDNGHCRRYGS